METSGADRPRQDRLKVLLVHNSYRLTGGEDQAFAAEAALLESRGHEVLRYVANNRDMDKLNTVALAQTTLWNHTAYREVGALLRATRPQVVHSHNTFPLISPAVYYAAHAAGAAVVQTLHNYRLLCPNGIFFRDGRICEDCLGKGVAMAGVAHACYRGSRAATAAVAMMVAAHRSVGTWERVVDLFIAPTEFARQKFIAGGIAADRIVVKPHFVETDPGPGDGCGEFALYVGRLSPEKGLDTLLEAWERLGGVLPLKVVGDGPLAERVAAAARRTAGVEWLGWQPKERVLALMREARLLVFPSVCYETFGLAITEAFSAGLPVIASDIGSMTSLIEHGETGLLFRAGDAADLAAQVERVLANPEWLAETRGRARRQYEQRYTAERNYQVLIDAYETALATARGRA